MRNYLTIGSVDSRTYGVYISGQGTFEAPARDYTLISIPGRNGDLVMDGKRYSNISVTYPAFIFKNFSQNLADFRNKLLQNSGYVKLTDSYHTDEYRMALYRGPFTPDVVRTNDAGSFDITFECKPQRFLNSGDTTSSVVNGGTVTNPTGMVALPGITVRSTQGAVNGTLTINSQAITISQPPFYAIFLDSERQAAYNGTNNLNAYVSGEFPVLSAGTNTVTWTGNITSVEIKPRWWRL